MSGKNEELKSLRPETVTVGWGYDPHSAGGAAKPPAFMSSTFVYPSAAAAKALHEAFFEGADNGATGYIYGRLGHPNLDIVEARLAALDRAEDAAIFASGMATISSILMTFAAPGDVVVASRPIYGGSDALIFNELSRFNIGIEQFADGLSIDSIRDAAGRAMKRGRVPIIWCETPANPLGSLVDLEAVRVIADEIAAVQGFRPLIGVDNTFLGPFAQNPLLLGADLCMTSLTKYAAGHSDMLAGGVSGLKELTARLKQFRTLVGSTLDAHSAWLLARSFETMHLRTQRAAENAAEVARLLRDHDKIASVRYVGFAEVGSPLATVYGRQCRNAGSTFSFDIKGGEEEAFRFLDRLKVLRMAVSLGGTETLICHSATTTHFAVPRPRRLEAGITDSTLRLSVGIEHVDDLCGDILQALEAV